VTGQRLENLDAEWEKVLPHYVQVSVNKVVETTEAVNSMLLDKFGNLCISLLQDRGVIVSQR
jgi:hypothetical protein